jgi:hypothetical protein
VSGNRTVLTLFGTKIAIREFPSLHNAFEFLSPARPPNPATDREWKSDPLRTHKLPDPVRNPVESNRNRNPIRALPDRRVARAVLVPNARGREQEAEVSKNARIIKFLSSTC